MKRHTTTLVAAVASHVGWLQRLAGAAVALASLGALAQAQDTSVGGILDAGSPNQRDRISRNGVVTVAPNPKPFPGTVASGPKTPFESFTFTNPTPWSRTVTVFLNPTFPPGSTETFASAYNGFYNPQNISQNYIGDMGSSPTVGEPGNQPFSFIIGPNGTVVIVVNQIDVGFMPFPTFNLDVSNTFLSSVNGELVLATNSVLPIHLAGDASTRRIQPITVSGFAILGGTLQIVSDEGYTLRRGDQFTVLTASGGVSGRFSSVTGGFTPGTILEPILTYKPFSVELDVQTFSQFANAWNLTPNQQAVAQALDSTNYSSKEAKLIDFLDNRQLKNLPGDFERIAPTDLTSIFTIGNSLATVQSLNVQRRTDDIRSGSSGFSAAGLALNGNGPSYSGAVAFRTGVAGPNGNVGLRDDGKEVKETKEVVPAESRWGAFLSGTGEWVSVGDTDNARGYNLESGGFTLGVDYKVTPNLAIGLAAGYTGTTADLVDRGRVWVNGGKIGLYGTFFQNEQPAPTMSKDSSKDSSKEAPAPAPSIAKGLYADVAVFGGYNSYDTRRSALLGEARGSTEGGELNVLFGAGYDFKTGGLTFGPTATFNYTYLGTEAFTEHDSLAPLNIHGGQNTSLRSAFGFKASYDIKAGSVLIKPELRAAWQHEYGDTTGSINADFANGAGNSFLVTGPEIGRDSALLGAGFAVQFNECCAIYSYYDGELGRKNYHSSAVTGGLRLAF